MNADTEYNIYYIHYIKIVHFKDKKIPNFKENLGSRSYTCAGCDKATNVCMSNPCIHINLHTPGLTGSQGRCYHASLALFLQVLLQQVRPCSPPALSAPNAHVRVHSHKNSQFFLASFDVCTLSFDILEEYNPLNFLPSSLLPICSLFPFNLLYIWPFFQLLLSSSFSRLSSATPHLPPFLSLFFL